LRHFITRLKRRLITSDPSKLIIRKSKKIILPGFSGIPLFDVVKFFIIQVQKTSLNERAAAISFNIMMALPPAFMFLFTLLPFLPIKGLMNELYQLIRDMIPGEKNNSVLIDFLSDFTTTQRNDLLSFGFIMALYFSSNAMIGIMRSLNNIAYIGFTKRNILHERWVAIKLTLILYIIIILSIAMLVLRGPVLDLLGIKNETIREIIFNTRWIIIVLIFFLTISFIYRHAPAVQKKWKLVNAGSLLATLMMLAFTMLFSYWVINFSNYHKLYGSIGAIIILMLLIFFNSLVLLIGFELNVSINSLRKLSGQRKN
jgi:membrane protein